MINNFYNKINLILEKLKVKFLVINFLLSEIKFIIMVNKYDFFYFVVVWDKYGDLGLWFEMMN